MNAPTAALIKARAAIERGVVGMTSAETFALLMEIDAALATITTRPEHGEEVTEWLDCVDDI